MRQNQPQVDGRTHTTNTPRQDTHGQHWMSARAMSAHFFTSLHPCLTQSGTYDGVESRGWSDTHSHCSAQFTSLITPNISIERPDAHLADGPTQDVAMANHRPYLRALTHVFHYVRCFIYTRTTGSRACALQRAPVGQGLLPPRPARAFGFWSLRALAKARRGRVYV